MDIEIRDMRNGEWCWINRAVVRDPHLTAADVRAYAALASYGGCAEIRPSFSDITARACLGKRTAKRAISNLERVGYIRVERRQGRGKSNRYDLLKAVNGCRLCTLSENVPNTTTMGAEKGRKKVPNSPPQENKEENIEKNNPPCHRLPIALKGTNQNKEDWKEFIQEMAAKDAVSPERVEWRMNRIAAKANGSIRKLSYFRTAFPDFLNREQFELIDHLTQHGANLCRENDSLGIPELIEEMKCEAARIGFHDYSDAVLIAFKNVRRGI